MWQRMAGEAEGRRCRVATKKVAMQAESANGYVPVSEGGNASGGELARVSPRSSPVLSGVESMRPRYGN